MTFDNINTLLFDLDGTLLGISDSHFEKEYTKLAVQRFKDIIDPDPFLNALWKSTEAMMREDSGKQLVWETFASSFTQLSGIDKDTAYEYFDKFYRNEFNKLQQHCDTVPGATEVIKRAKENDFTVIMATNPVFLEIATKNRMEWVGLDYSDFLVVTHIENSNYCKPHAGYYKDLLKVAKIQPQEALMIGNDYFYDMAASALGIQTWITDRYLDKEEYKNKFPPKYNGSIMDLIDRITG